MSGGSPELPVLFCFDGSEGSRRALRAASELIVRPVTRSSSRCGKAWRHAWLAPGLS